MDFQRLYEFRFRDVDQRSRESVWKPIAAFVHEEMGRPARILDPAAGRGEFINEVPAAERWAVERTPQWEAMDAGVKVVVGDALEVELPEGHFDGIFVSNFLEHLATPETVFEFLRRMLDATAVGGRIAIMGPNIRYCAKEYWDCADHYLGLTHVAVEEHLYMAGFEPVKTHPRFLPYSFRGVLPPSGRLTSWYLRTPPAWRVLGKQFLVIARRPVP